ncbi:MAG: AAA family ATPase [Phycisphaerae bacterium]|nr:AAA family ATPase [Phycisphaerae bacterium]
MNKKTDSHQTIREWLERDLTQAALDDELAPAFEVEETLAQMADVIAAGRHPVLIGEPGVGKTAIIHEWARRLARGNGPPGLVGRRVIQFSLEHRAASMKTPEHLRPEVHKLVDALLELQDEIIPFIRDFHRVYHFDVEPHFESLAFRFRGPILAEGATRTTEMLFESFPAFEQYYLPFRVQEPSPERMARILRTWGEDQSGRAGVRYEPEATDLALHLACRFLSRGHLPRMVIDQLGQLGALVGGRGKVVPADVIQRFCGTHGVPREVVDPDVVLDLERLRGEFRTKILGQPRAVDAVVSLIGLVKAGLSDVRRAFGAFLFVGPTGVGKTHIAQLLAEYLFGGRDQLIRVNMADYGDERGASVLFGDPNGHRAQDIRGVLTLRVLGQQFGVLLLDEFEKAHASVRDRFLQLMDEGCFINGAGELVSCRSTILIATSNAGAEVYRGHAFGFAGPMDLATRDRELERALERHFRIEFLNRFDQIVHFHPLSREDIRLVALRELECLKQRSGLKNRHLCIEIDESVLDWLAANGYDMDYGARFLRRTIERHVATALATAIVRHNPAPGSTIELTVRQNSVVARVAEPAPVPRRSAVLLPVGSGERTRRLSPTEMAAETERLLAAAQERFDELRAKREEYSQLLVRMNEPSFWDDAERRGPVLERFRELDVTIRMEERLAEPIRRLAEYPTVDSEARVIPQGWPEALAAAAGSLAAWQEHLDSDGPGAVWLVIGSPDPLQSAAHWIEDLVKMELAWCRRHLRLAASLVAYEPDEKDLRKAVLDIEGPGAFACLSMEAGLHRLRRSSGSDFRARIDVVPKGPAPAGHWPELARNRHRDPVCLGVRPTFRARLEFAERGLAFDLVGEAEYGLNHAVHDLAAAWRGPKESPSAQEVARIYNEDGSGARDPRTGALAPHFKQILRGQLEVFLTAWRQRTRSG